MRLGQCYFSIGGQPSPAGHRIAIGRGVSQPIDRCVDRQRIHRPGQDRQLVLIVASVAMVGQKGVHCRLQRTVRRAVGDPVEPGIELCAEAVIAGDEPTERP